MSSSICPSISVLVMSCRIAAAVNLICTETQGTQTLHYRDYGIFE